MQSVSAFLYNTIFFYTYQTTGVGDYLKKLWKKKHNKATNNKQTTNNKQQTTNNKQQTTKQQTTNNKQQTTKQSSHCHQCYLLIIKILII